MCSTDFLSHSATESSYCPGTAKACHENNVAALHLWLQLSEIQHAKIPLTANPAPAPSVNFNTSLRLTTFF